MPVIDWLELLWKAAEEGGVDLLPGEPDLLSAKTGGLSREGENGENVPVQHLAEELKPQISAWQIPKGLETAESLGDVEFRKAAELLKTVEPDPEKSYFQSILRDVKRPIGGGAVQQIYRSAAESALTVLYRRVRETVSSEKPGIPGRNSTVVVREEVPAAPGLTEEGLDRSLRRDSRRYDGGMNIY